MIAQFNREQPVKNLPDAYRKDINSNNRKILEIERDAMNQLRAGINAIDACLDLNQAAGKTLDLYGEMLDQPRGAATDEQYRIMIMARITRALARSDHDSIVHAISTAFGCDPSEVLLVEPEGTCSVRLESLPFDKLNSSGIDTITAVQIVKRLIPAGVQLESLNFSGTFEFGDIETVYDEETGFGDVDQTVGGHLGLAADSKTASNLPV